jgi:hypothetical protein
MSSEALASRAQAYIAAMPPAISGQHGHDTTFAVAKKLIHDFGMSEAEAWPIFLDYNARCQPPWNEDEIAPQTQGRWQSDQVKNPTPASPGGDRKVHAPGWPSCSLDKNAGTSPRPTQRGTH